MEPNTSWVWAMVTMRHVVVPLGVVGSVVPKANVWRASSSGKLSRERAADWYTNFEPRVTIDDAMRVARLVR